MIDVSAQSLDLQKAKTWVRSRLVDDDSFGAVVTSAMTHLEQAIVITANRSVLGDLELNDVGTGLDSTDVDRELNRILARIVRTSNSRALLVADDLARVGDPAPDGNYFSARDRYVTYAPASADEGAKFIRSGASGYPTIALLTTVSPEQMGIVPTQAINEAQQLLLASNVSALICSVFDAETFVVLSR